MKSKGLKGTSGHLEFQKEIIKDFIKLDSKQISVEALHSYIERLQAAIRSKKITPDSHYIVSFRRIQAGAIKAYNYAKKEKLTHLTLDIAPVDLNQYKADAYDVSSGTFKQDVKKYAGLKGKKPFSKPTGAVDKDTSRELELYIENDNQLYNSQTVPIIKNLVKKKESGKYDHELSKKLWMYLVEAGIKKYRKEYDLDTVSAATKYDVADSFAEMFETQYENGEYNHFKKQASQKKINKALTGVKKTIVKGSSSNPIGRLTAMKIAGEWNRGKESFLERFSRKGIFNPKDYEQYKRECSAIMSVIQKHPDYDDRHEKDIVLLSDYLDNQNEKYGKSFKSGKSPLKGTPKCILPNPKEIQELASSVHGLGFVQASKQSEIIKPSGYTLPGEVGKLLGVINPFKYSIVLTGDFHSGKTEFVTQLIDSFIDAGKKVGAFMLEQGGFESQITTDAVNRNVKGPNQKNLFVTGVAPDGVSSVREATKMYDVIVVDSFQKLGVPAAQYFDKFREDYPGTVFIFIFQQNAAGGVKGGAAPGFDSPVVLKVHKMDTTFVNNYVEVVKNRGNDLNIHYVLGTKKTYEGHVPNAKETQNV